jgi:hypothetical protein
MLCSHDSSRWRCWHSAGIRFLGPPAILFLAVACPNDSRTEDSHTQLDRPAAATDDGDRMMGESGMMGDDGMMGEDGEMGDNGMMDDDGMMGEMMNDMPSWMMSRGMTMDHSMMPDMGVIHDLLRNHEKVRREVENIPGGVRTVTTSSDPAIAESIRTHVHQMKNRIEEGRSIRHMDPLFREIFEHHEKIEMQIEEVPGGIRVTETSDDPQVTLLIRQHARRAVSEFVEKGMQRAMQPTPLPEAYRR